MWNGSERTAALALLAAMPGLVLTAVAACGSNALTIRADLLLSLLDAAALAAVWCGCRCGHGPDAERLASGLVALCMAGSLVLISWLALERLYRPVTPLEGAGLVLASILNGGYAVFNAWLLCRWRRLHRQAPSRLARAQIRLFGDKLTSNLLIVGALTLSLGLEGLDVARFIDPVAGLAMAAATAWWSAPTIAAGLREVGDMLRGVRCAA